MSDPKDNKRPVNLSENPIYDSAFEKMLKDFSRQIEKSGIIQEVKNRQYYEKPSEIHHRIVGTIKRKAKLARRRRKKK